MNLVTGYRGTKHVTSADMAAFNRVIFGGGDYVINAGNCLAASYSDTNILHISDGEMLIQGHHARIDVGDYEEVTLTAGTSGMYRKDYIAAQYEKASDGTESVTVVDIVGTTASSESTASLPTLTQEDLTNYGSIRQVALYTVTFSGLSAGDPVQVFELTENIEAQIDDKQDTITGAATSIIGSDLTASRALISNSSGKVAASDITSTELGYLDGASSNIQAQLDSFTTWANKIGVYYDTASEVSLSSNWAYSILKLADGTLSPSGGNTTSTVSSGYWIAPFSCFAVAYARATFSAYASGSRVVQLVRCNSSNTITATLGETKTAGINHEQQISATGVVYMAAGDKLDIRVGQDSGKTLTVSAQFRVLVIPNL